MASKRERIILAVVTAVTDIEGVREVIRAQVDAVPRDAGTVIAVASRVDEQLALHNDQSERSLEIQVHVIVRSDSPSPDAVADIYMTEAHARIMEDTTLGGIVLKLIDTETRWDIESADLDVAVVTTIYRASYRAHYKQLT